MITKTMMASTIKNIIFDGQQDNKIPAIEDQHELGHQNILEYTLVTYQKKWRSQIEKNKKGFYLEDFENEIDAAIAYNKKAIELHGEFANINHI